MATLVGKSYGVKKQPKVVKKEETEKSKEK